jgi:hypothetical protein
VAEFVEGHHGEEGGVGGEGEKKESA